MAIKNPLLRRYWFHTGPETGFGVTAFSLEDAKQILEAVYPKSSLDDITKVTEDIDIQDLELNHVRKNMGPTIFRGIWYPCHNLGSKP